MTVEYRIVRTDEHFPEEIYHPLPDLELVKNHLAQLRDWHPSWVLKVQPVVPARYLEVLDV